MGINLAGEMIVPKHVNDVPIASMCKDVAINFFVKDGIVAKRVEACAKEAIVFHGCSNQIINRHKTEFEIINALFVTFTPKTPEDYLCLIGKSQIDFYALADGMFCSLALPFKISQAHPSNFGLILERTSFPSEFGNPPGTAQLFSLTHPYNEIFPILCKFKNDLQCHYTFRDRKMSIVPKDIAANWCSDYFGQVDLLMCYDLDERTNHIFMIRKCSKEERIAAKSDLGVLNSSALMHTPSTIRSFYSPNFFNRRFANNRLATLANADAHQQSHSPASLSAISFPNGRFLPKSLQQPQQGTSSSSPRITPTSRRITRSMTRSMAAPELMPATTSFHSHTGSVQSSFPSTSMEKSPSFHRSLERNATLNRLRLKQKLALVASSGGVTSSSFQTPHQRKSFLDIDMDDLLSFGGKEDDDEPPASLDMAVEFCLEWLWSEPIPVEESARSGSSSSSVSVINEKMANRMERLRVSSSASSHSDETANKCEGFKSSRMASAFFLTKCSFSKYERFIVFHIPLERKIRLLLLEESNGANFQDFHLPTVSDLTQATQNFIRGNGVIPFLHAPYFLVLDTFLASDSSISPSSIILYCGPNKIAHIALSAPSLTQLHLQRILPAGLMSADDQNLYEFRLITDERDEDAESDTCLPVDAKLFICHLQLGFTTKIAHHCLMSIVKSLGHERRIPFYSKIISLNPWRIVESAQKIPFINSFPIENIELVLLFEQYFIERGIGPIASSFTELLNRIRQKMNGNEYEEIEGGSATKRTRLDLNNSREALINDDHYWHLFSKDMQLKSTLKNQLKEAIREINSNYKIIRNIDLCQRTRLSNLIASISEKQVEVPPWKSEPHKWITAPVWTTDLRVHNIEQILDSSQPILIPSKALGPSFNDVQQREQLEQFLLSVALRTVTRPFGQAILNFRTRHGFQQDAADTQMGVKAMCLNGRVHPGRQQIDYPLNDTNPAHKLTMDWANFYNALARGLTFCGGFSPRLFSTTLREDELHPTTRAGLLLAAGLNGGLKDTMNLYDIHSLLTQNDRQLVIALLIGCAATHRGTSEVHVYKMIAAHLPFLLQPTLCEFRIELIVQTAALLSLGLLFSETANQTVSNQLLNQMALEVPCESDQSFERYSFVLTAGIAIGLINLGKGKELTETEIPISLYPTLKDRLIKMLNGSERRLAYLNYDQVYCPGMRVDHAMCLSGTGSLVGRRFNTTPGGTTTEGIADSGPNGQNSNSTQQFSSIVRDHSGIGQPQSNHVRELTTMNIHLTSPAAAIALGLMYLRTGDAWIREVLSITDTFYAINKIRPDMLMIRTLCCCLVDFDQINCTYEWIEAHIPNIVSKYAQLFVQAKSKNDVDWSEFVDLETVAKSYFYCLAGACFAMALRFASSWETKAVRIIQNFYEQIENIEEKPTNEYSWIGLARKAGRNCISACINVCAICMGLIMAGSGDLQSTRILRKIRNSIPGRVGIPPKDNSVHSLHVSANMALGLLYLGKGRLSLDNSNFSVAALVISLFPLFPHSIADNRFYFQPLRFLWMLAVKGHKANRHWREPLANNDRRTYQTVDCKRCGTIPITIMS